MKKTLMILLILAAVGGLALTACGGGGAALDGTAWTLADLNGSPPIAGTLVTAQFADGQVSGNASCNSYGGSYQTKGDSLTTSALFMTEMACLEPAGAMDQESTYLDILSRAASYQMNGSQLVITTSGGESLTFVAAS